MQFLVSQDLVQESKVILSSALLCYYPISRSCIDEGKFISDDQIFVFMAKGKSKSKASKTKKK